MKKFIAYACATLLVSAGFFYCSSSQPARNGGPDRIVIIRHGEKPDQGDNLSCQGLSRALQLPAVLNSKFGTPSTIYVPAIDMGKSTDVARMYQTIVPFAIKYNLKVNTKYEVDDVNDLVAGIGKRQGTVLVVWEHKAIGKILKALGLPDKEKWPDDDFDSIWIITYKNGAPVLTKDHENIHPGNNCP